MKIPRQCPLVLIVKVGWRGGKMFGCEEVWMRGGTTKPKPHFLIFKHSVLTSKKTQLTALTITMIRCSMLFKEIVSVYCENHMNPIDMPFGQNAELVIVKAGTLGFKRLNEMLYKP
jgi:hypothetical protein